MKLLFSNEDIIVSAIPETKEYEIDFFRDGHYLTGVTFSMTDLYELQEESAVVKFS